MRNGGKHRRLMTMRRRHTYRYPRRRQRRRGISMSDARIRHMILFIIAFVSVAIWMRLGLLSYVMR